MVLQVYLDESGTHGTSSVVAVGAGIAVPTVWKKWTKAWAIKKKPIKIHHAIDCHNRKGEYEGWSREERDDYVKRLLPVIPKHKIAGRVTGINVKAFRAELAASRPDVADWFNLHPYFPCLLWTLNSVVKFATASKHKRVAFIHENNNFEDEVLKWFDLLNRNYLQQQISANLSFGSKAAYPPLQCADVLAYEGNHYARNTLKAPRRAFEMLDPTRERIKLIMLDPPKSLTRNFTWRTWNLAR